MMLKLNKPLSLNKQGKRKNNEDAFSIPENAKEPQVFIVCDGVGGASKGEVASHLACTSIINFYKQNKTENKDKTFWQNALKFSEKQFTQEINKNPKCKGMGTTLVLAHPVENKMQVVWCGDSRLYQFRNGKIIYKTKDHSFVQKLVDEGQITEEEALVHPRKNIILRAINGEHNPSEIDFIELNDVQTDDIFFLCSDGIIEFLTDAQLEQIITLAGNDYVFAIDQIDAYCQTHSNDNYTCVLFSVAGLKEEITPKAPEKKEEKTFASSKMGLFLMGGLALFLLAFASYFLTKEDKSSNEFAKTQSPKTKVISNEIEKKDSLKNNALSVDSLKATETEITNFSISEGKKKIKIYQKNDSTYTSIKDSLKSIMLGEYFKIDSLRKAKNDTSGRFFEVQDLVRGRFLYSVAEFGSAFDALKNWTKHEWRDSLLTKNDWLILHELYSQQAVKDSSFIEQILICEKQIFNSIEQSSKTLKEPIDSARLITP